MFGLGLPELMMMFLPLLVLFLVVVPALLRWLWNITMPDVFGLSQITYWQAFRLWIMAVILFGSGRIGS